MDEYFRRPKEEKMDFQEANSSFETNIDKVNVSCSACALNTHTPSMYVYVYALFLLILSAV